MGFSSEEKWGIIHGPFKAMIEGALTAFSGPAMYYFKGKGVYVESKDMLKSNELKRLWSAWDIAFEEWEKETGLLGYKSNRSLYNRLVCFRNVIFTVIDNDGPYLKLLYQLIRAWEKVQESDEYLK